MQLFISNFSFSLSLCYTRERLQVTSIVFVYARLQHNFCCWICFRHHSHSVILFTEAESASIGREKEIFGMSPDQRHQSLSSVPTASSFVELFKVLPGRLWTCSHD